jgi:protein TonB
MTTAGRSALCAIALVACNALAEDNGTASAASVASGPATTAAAPPAPAASHPAQVFLEPRCRPEYPAAAMRAGAMGTTGIRFSVDAQGRVRSAEITQSAGPTREHRLLDNAAKVYLATCRFAPAADDSGAPIGSTVDLTYTWQFK